MSQDGNAAERPGPGNPVSLPELKAFRVIRRLGAGGMGEVYLAEDRRLRRTVAIKVLAAALSADEIRRARFRREAELLAALNHPNICTLYSVEREGERDILVMEAVEGTPLSRHIGAKGMSLPEFFGIALPIAEALAAAHAKGIVHRDLKPENVLITPVGGVKVLDFGVAHRERIRPAGGRAVTGEEDLPTTLEELSLTMDGQVLGTVAYMSPEQIQGQPVDARSDLFSLGVLFHQMLTGLQPFTGDSWTAVLASILRDTPPPVTALRPELPPALGRVVTRLQAKAPDRRYQSALDLRNDLEELRDSAAEGPRTGRGHARLAGRRLAAGLLLTALAAAALTNMVVRDRLRPPSRPVVTQVRPLTTARGAERYGELSPDGSQLAYSTGRPLRIRIRTLASGTDTALCEEAPGDQLHPRWSPDGGRILFEQHVKTTLTSLWVAPVAGGVAEPLERDAAGAAWSPDGSEIAFARDATIVARRVAGGETRVVVQDAAPGADGLDWSPDGNWIAFTRGNPGFSGPMAIGNRGPAAIEVVSARGGLAREVTDRDFLHSSPAWSSDGRRLYFVSNRGGSLDVWYRHLDEEGAGSGPIERLTTQMNAHSVSMSQDGRQMLISDLPGGANLWSLRIPAPGEPPLTLADAEPVTSGAQSIESASISRDGRWIAYDSSLAGNQDIYVAPVEGGEPRRITTSPADDFAPTWSPDGQRLAYYSLRTGPRTLFVADVAEGGEWAVPTPTLDALFCPDWSPDGTEIAFLGDGREGGIFLMTTSDVGRTWSAPRFLVTLAGCPRWAPDSRSLTYGYGSDLRIVGHDGRSKVVQTGLFGARFAVWSHDGRWIYYRTSAPDPNALHAVPAEGGEPRLLASLDHPWRSVSRFELSASADRFYVILRENEGDLWLLDLEERR